MRTLRIYAVSTPARFSLQRFCLLILVFLVALMLPGLAFSKKPTCPGHPSCKDDPPASGDICADFAAPDFVFWRDTGSRKARAKTIFVAESATGCEKEVLRIDLTDIEYVNRLNLAYSSFGTGETFFGRVVYQIDIGLVSSEAEAKPVWKYDFGISEGQIQPAEGPLPVLENIDPEDLYVRGLDLSADTHSLVWKFRDQSGDVWKESIRTLNIDGCQVWPCESVAGGNSLVEYDHYGHTDPSTGTYLQNPVWGPLGNRIYFVAREFQPDSSHSHYVMAIAADGSQSTKIFGIKDQDPGDPNYRHIRSVASGLSGWPDDGEYLAVEIGDDNMVWSCADVYTLNVASCEDADPNTQCELQYELGGNFMTWTRSGAILLTGMGGACKYNQIGIWDGTDVNIITKGYEPEAAGGG